VVPHAPRLTTAGLDHAGLEYDGSFEALQGRYATSSPLRKVRCLDPEPWCGGSKDGGRRRGGYEALQ
jgi:hypothetical protein